MKTVRRFLLLAQIVPILALIVPLVSTDWPLGVRGEWEWLRLARGPSPLDVGLAASAVLAYSALSVVGFRFLRKKATPGREALAIAGLLAASVAAQAIVPWGAPAGYGLAKWSFVLHAPASTGYYTVARREIGDPGRFLTGYPDWIAHQDALHVGTHPPGLFLAEHALLRSFESRPVAARWVVDHLPATVIAGFRAIDAHDPLPMADRATLGFTGALTLLACASTVVPLYALARASLPAPRAWSSAVFWPLVPAAVLFQPVADTAFPLLATSALAFTAHSVRSGMPRGWALALSATSGLALALGMAFTLAFLPVGLVVGLILATAPGLDRRRRVSLLLATGAGFLAPTLLAWLASGANPFVIWWRNQRNHARFYVEYRRTYLAWVLVNPLELAVALGIPATIWAITGLTRGRNTPSPRVAWATLAVLVLLTISGRNLSEVARLWLPFMPALLTATGHGLDRLGGGPITLGGALMLQGAQTLLLQATIQVTYPV